MEYLGYKTKTIKEKSIVGQRVRDFKNKTCTLIKWK